MEKWGYVRVSTTRAKQEAGWDDQIAQLKKLGVEPGNIIKEEASTRDTRPLFEDMLSRAAKHYQRTGKKVVICATKLDRAFRDVSAASAAICGDDYPGVIWHLPDVSAAPLDPSDPGQKLLVHMMAAIAQFERDRLAERRAYGIAKAKKDGKYKGRKPTARAKTDEVMKLKARGFTPDEIHKQLDIGRASVYRILKEQRETSGRDC